MSNIKSRWNLEVSSRKILAIGIWLLFFLIFTAVSLVYENTKLDNEGLRGLCVLAVMVYLFAFAVWYVYTRKIASLFFVFLIYCFLFNAGQLLLGIFDMDFLGTVNIFKDYGTSLLMQMIVFQCRAVLMMLLGAILAYREEPYLLVCDEHVGQRQWIVFKKWRVVDVLFLLIAAMLFLIYLREVSLRGSVNYGDYYYGEREGVSVPLLFFYHVLMYKVYTEHEKDSFLKLVLWINVIMVILMLMVGSRNAVIQIIFGCLFLRMYVKKQQIKMSFGKTILILIGAWIAILFFTGIQDLRQYSLSELSLDIFIEVYSDGLMRGVVDSLIQMGGSARCILKTMQMLNMGFVTSEPTYLYSLLKSFIPVGLISAMGIEQPINQSLATWITEVGGSHSGWGYSIFAEMYYNFKEWGWLFGFAWAFVYVRLEQKALVWIKKGQVLLGCAITYILAYAIFLARADSILITTRIRYAFYVFIVLYICNHVKSTKVNIK